MRPILSIVQLRSLGDNALTDYAADIYLELKRAEQQSQACLRRIADISRTPYRTVLKVLEGTAFAVGILTLTVSPLGLIAAFGIPALTNGVNWLADRARAKTLHPYLVEAHEARLRLRALQDAWSAVDAERVRRGLKRP